LAKSLLNKIGGICVDCTIDIIKEGNFVLAYLPFNPRTEFGIPKGSIFVNCNIGGREFKSKLMSKGNGNYSIFFSKQLIKNLDLNENEYFNVRLNITPDSVNSSELAEPELLDNETIKAIRERASIRLFTNKEVSKLIVDTILNAGLCAPSATNKRPFHFVVTQSREKMTHIMENNTYAKMLKDSAACIIVCGDKVMQGISELLIEDCSAATQNMLLAIHSLGLGGVWCGIRQSSDFYKDMVREFNLPNYIRPIALIAFGYPDEEKVQPNRYETNKIHIEAW
jgi:nitroreductase